MADSFRRPTRLKTISSNIDYIMCIDENGSEALLKQAEAFIENNNSVPIDDKYLTITGVIFTRSDYSNTYFEIEQLKKKYWKDGLFNNGIAVCFHSCDIRRKKPPFDDNSINRNAFLNDLTEVLENTQCKIISSSINVENYIKSGKYHYDIYNTAIQFLIERYIYATKNGKKGIIVLESRDQKQDKKILENINRLFENGTTIIKAKEFKEKVIGSYAIGLICTNEPDTLYAIKKNSPLIIGYGEDENYIASDIIALSQYTTKYIVLSDGDYAKLDSNHVHVYDNNGKSVEREIKTFISDGEIISKNGYEHYMLKEIAGNTTLENHLFYLTPLKHLLTNIISVHSITL